MKPLTLRQVRDALNELSDEQLDTTATVYIADQDECFAVNETILLSELPVEVQDNHDFDYDVPLIVI